MSVLNKEEDKPSRRAAWLALHAKDTALCAAINEACEAYGDTEVEVLCLSKPDNEVAVFRAPLGAEYERFMGGVLAEKVETKAKAATNMAVACVLYPAKATFRGWCDRYGGIGNACLKPLSRLAGAELVDRGKE